MSTINEEPRGEQILDNAYKKMFLALEKGGYNSIAEAAFRLINMPIIIVNAELKKLAQYPDKIIGDPIWDNYFDKHEMTPQMTWQLLEDSIIKESENCERPIWLDRSLVEDIPRLVGNFKIDGVIEGYVGVLFSSREYSEIHVRLTDLVCRTVALEMQKDFLDSRVKQIEYLLNLYKLESGVSNIFDDLLDIATYKYQAEQALDVGRSRNSKDTIFVYNDIVLENIMSSVRNQIEPQNYIHPAIDILRAYDQKNGTEYLKTLKIYITSMCRHHVTVEALHIHRNTLLYRLKKIEELTGASLEDERFCALLLCNFYLLSE